MWWWRQVILVYGHRLLRIWQRISHGEHVCTGIRMHGLRQPRACGLLPCRLSPNQGNFKQPPHRSRLERAFQANFIGLFVTRLPQLSSPKQLHFSCGVSVSRPTGVMYNPAEHHHLLKTPKYQKYLWTPCERIDTSSHCSRPSVPIPLSYEQLSKANMIRLSFVLTAP